MSEWTTMTWSDAMQHGYQALCDADAIYDELDLERQRSNLDIEKHLRRAEIKLAAAHAWFAMARELGEHQARDSGSTG
jgi:hypothetical protein